MWRIVTVGVAWSVCLLVAVVDQIVTIISSAKAAKLIELPFGLWTMVDPRNHVLGRGPDPPCKRAILRGDAVSHCKV